MSTTSAIPVALAASFAALVLPPGKPRRIALMTGKEAPKYHDAPSGHVLSPDDLIDHLAGRRTWAATMLDKDRMARAGCRDYDGDADQGEALGLIALDRAKAAGLTASAILLGGRSHVWVFYAKPAPASDIAAQLREVLPAGTGEIFPSGNNIRLPIGLHRVKGTRGTLVLQDGRRFDLDDPAERESGLRALIAVARNAAPPVSVATGNVRSDTPSTAVDMTLYHGCSAEQGSMLWASKRLQAIITASDNLSTIAHGERVSVLRDGIPDDSDSAQLAALVYGLMRSHRKGEKPGVGAVPEGEIRSIALFLYPQLRPDASLGKYRWQIEYELTRYRPEHYAPSPTEYLAGKQSATPTRLPPARTARVGRPVGALRDGLERCAALLPEGAEFTRATLAAALTTTIKSVGRYLAELRSGYGLITQQDTCTRVMRVVCAPTKLKDNNGLPHQDALNQHVPPRDNNSPVACTKNTPRDNNSKRRPDAVNAASHIPLTEMSRDNNSEGHYAPISASQSHLVCIGENTPAPVPPAAAGTAIPASLPAPPLVAPVITQIAMGGPVSVLPHGWDVVRDSHGWLAIAPNMEPVDFPTEVAASGYLYRRAINLGAMA